MYSLVRKLLLVCSVWCVYLFGMFICVRYSLVGCVHWSEVFTCLKSSLVECVQLLALFTCLICLNVFYMYLMNMFICCVRVHLLGVLTVQKFSLVRYVHSCYYSFVLYHKCVHWLDVFTSAVFTCWMCSFAIHVELCN